MPIAGIGLDVVELSRISRCWDRFGSAFARRILTPEELRLLPRQAVAYLASRFAAKEAAVKALGTGFSQGITFQQIEILSLATGQPFLTLHQAARSRFTFLGANRAHLSLTHGRDVAAAMVVLEG